MDKQEITGFLDALENLWLENIAARNYLAKECKIANPGSFLQERVKEVRSDAVARHMFAGVRQAIGQSLQDSEVLKALCKALPEP